MPVTVCISPDAMSAPSRNQTTALPNLLGLEITELLALCDRAFKTSVDALTDHVPRLAVDRHHHAGRQAHVSGLRRLLPSLSAARSTAQPPRSGSCPADRLPGR